MCCVVYCLDNILWLFPSNVNLNVQKYSFCNKISILLKNMIKCCTKISKMNKVSIKNIEND